MPIYQGLVSAYARAIYVDGTKRFPDILSQYEQPVKEYAANNYYRDQIEFTHNQGWITDQEWRETISLIIT